MITAKPVIITVGGRRYEEKSRRSEWDKLSSDWAHETLGKCVSLVRSGREPSKSEEIEREWDGQVILLMLGIGEDGGNEQLLFTLCLTSGSNNLRPS